ncbi:MAG: hypothetical protein ABIG60_06080 [Patescibacteria group bacterium]
MKDYISKVMEMAKLIIKAGHSIEIRQVPLRVTNEEVDSLPRNQQPFLYASGNWGVGYVSIKSLVAILKTIQTLSDEMGNRLLAKDIRPVFVAGNITGGVIPGWELSLKFERELQKPVHFIHVKGTRRIETGKQLITMVNKAALEQVVGKFCQAVVQGPRFDFVVGQVPGGMIPAYRLSQKLSALLGRNIPFVYARDQRKAGGQKELITGMPYLTLGSTGLVIGQVNDLIPSTSRAVKDVEEEGFKVIDGAELLNSFDPRAIQEAREIETAFNQDFPFIPAGSSGVVVEELVNFAESTGNSTRLLRDAGFKVNHAATILFYGNPEAMKQFQELGLDMTWVLTLRELLDADEQYGSDSIESINDYRAYLDDQLGWQERRGLKPKSKGGTI